MLTGQAKKSNPDSYREKIKTGTITARSRLGSLINLWYYCGFGNSFLFVGYERCSLLKWFCISSLRGTKQSAVVIFMLFISLKHLLLSLSRCKVSNQRKIKSGTITARSRRSWMIML